MNNLEELLTILAYFGLERPSDDHDMEDFRTRAEAAILNYGENLIHGFSPADLAMKEGIENEAHPAYIEKNKAVKERLDLATYRGS